MQDKINGPFHREQGMHCNFLGIEHDHDDCISMDSLDVFPHQVGGHHLLVRHPTHPELLVRPLIEKEFKFYENAKQNPELQQVISRYYGIVAVTLDAQSHKCPPLIPPNGDQNHLDNTVECIVLEDLTFGMEEPCVLDMKIGKRLYDDDATSDKVERMIRKSASSTSGSIGFRISGIRYLDKDSGAPVLKLKKDVRNLSMAELGPMTMDFFNGLSQNDKIELIDFYLGRLLKIYQVVLGSNARFYSSSILFLYGHGEGREGERRMDCKMIDFVHSKIYPKDAVEVIDDNYLDGLKNLIDYFRNIRGEVNACK